MRLATKAALALTIWAGSLAWGLAQTTSDQSQPASRPSSKYVDLSSELTTATDNLKKTFAPGITNADQLAGNQAEIEGLIRQYASTGKREQVARLYLLDAHIYADGLTNTDKAQAIWGQVIRDFPSTAAAKGARISLAKSIAAAAQNDDPNIPEGLEIGQRFPSISEMDTTENVFTTSGHRGKILLVDFWATWCPPCREEIPNVVAAYKQYHAQSFDIMGISLDNDLTTLADFTAAHGMTWPEYCDTLVWTNKLVVKYQIQGIPMNYLLDRHGIIIGKNLRGDELANAVQKALGGQTTEN